MNPFPRIGILIPIFLMILSVPCAALEIVSQDPTMDHYFVSVDEPLTLVFDASLDVGTVTADNVKIQLASDSSVPSFTLSVETTTLTDDTVILNPDSTLVFGRPYEFVISTGLTDSVGTPFSETYPFGQRFVCNIPNDLVLPDYFDPGDFDSLTAKPNPLLGFDPMDPEGTDESNYWRIPGISVTEAWKYTTGRADVLVAIVDDGIESYDDPDLVNRLFLNVGEMPLPDVGGAPCIDYDCNGDGRVNIEDYLEDSRLLAATGGTPPDPGTCIEVFSDSVDDDGNGLIDDICGWDFFRGVNEVLGVDEFPEGTHGGGRSGEIVAPANDGNGSRPGICPDCTLLPIRVSEAVVADYNILNAGIRYAHTMGASLVGIAMGGLSYNDEAHQAVLDAYEDDMLIIAASGDELGFHHIYPAAGEDVINIKSIFPFPPMDLLSIFPLELIAFTESYCTNFGAHTHLTVPASYICTSEAVGNTTGAAALILSRARDLGFTLSANELKQIMTMSANDIKNRCVTLTPGGCQPGFDEHFGYGRMNTKLAMERLGNPDLGVSHTIPPAVRITSPKWWEPLNPVDTPSLTFTGQISARAPSYHYQLEFAQGVEPRDGAFTIIKQANSFGPIDGDIFTIDLGSLIPPGVLRRQPLDPNDKTVTFRLRAYWKQGGEKIWGEARKAVTLNIDDDPRTGLIDGFPMYMGASGESSIVLYDLDQDEQGMLEMIFGTSDGAVHVLAHNADTGAWEELDGFPVDVSGDNPQYDEGVFGACAVGDLMGTGSGQIVAATTGGHVFAVWQDGNNHAGGPFLPGFPVAAQEPLNDSAYIYGHGRGFIASPVLSDLDLDGQLEVIAASYDQYVYAWKPDDGTGQVGDLPGWPVLLSSNIDEGLVPWAKRCGGPNLPAPILGSPGAFVIDPENANPDLGEHPAVIVPVSETCETELLNTSRVYAVFWDGMDHEGGPFLPDWPATPFAPFGDAIPIPPLTIGMNNSPAAAYIDGETRISTGGFFWFPEILTYDGGILDSQTLPTQVNMTITSNGTFAPIKGDGTIQFLLPTVGFLNNLDGRIYAEAFNTTAWDIEGDPEILFRHKMDDIVFFTNPAVAELSGDDLPEVVVGSGGYLLHVFDVNGDVPTGYPKMTGGWITTSPAMADIDRDGLFEIALFTHEGYVFVWETEGPACNSEGSAASWPKFRHDEHNTGLLGFDATPPGMVTDLKALLTLEGDYDLRFSAAGDDNLCGQVAGYEIRFSANPDDDLRDLAVFQAAQSADVQVDTTELVYGSLFQKINVETDDDPVIFAVRAYDEKGMFGPISTIAVVTDEPVDDDDDDDDREVGGVTFPDSVPEPVIDKGEDIGCGC